MVCNLLFASFFRNQSFFFLFISIHSLSTSISTLHWKRSTERSNKKKLIEFVGEREPEKGECVLSNAKYTIRNSRCLNGFLIGKEPKPIQKINAHSPARSFVGCCFFVFAAIAKSQNRNRWFSLLRFLFKSYWKPSSVKLAVQPTKPTITSEALVQNDRAWQTKQKKTTPNRNGRKKTNHTNRNSHHFSFFLVFAFVRSVAQKENWLYKDFVCKTESSELNIRFFFHHLQSVAAVSPLYSEVA